MSLFGAVLGIGAKLFGAKRAEKREDAAIAAQNAYNSPEQIRERAEKAGFNPLLFVGPGVGQQVSTGGSNYFGSAIADAGLMVADALSKRKEAAQISALESENKELRKKAEAATLRPKVGGIYDRRQAVPTLRQALGVPDADAADTFDRAGPYSGPAHSRSIDSVDPESRASTETVQSHGSATSLPLGPDPDEVFTGWLVDLNNKEKARRRFENSSAARSGRAQRFAPSWPSQSKTAGQAFRFNPRPLNPPKPSGWAWPVPAPNLGEFR